MAQSSRYGIVLQFDPVLENQISEAWNILAEMTNNPEIRYTPYMPLFVAPFVEIDKVEKMLRLFAAKQGPFPVSFHFANRTSTLGESSIGTIASPSIVEIRYLMDDVMKKQGIDFGGVQYGKYDSVAEKLPPTVMADAFSALGDLNALTGDCVAISLIKYSPVPQLCASYPLGMKYPLSKL